MKKKLRWAGLGIAVVFLAIQFVRPARENPAVDQSMSIAAQTGFTPPVSSLIKAACFDCHSNETRWPWYSNVSPVCWLVADDVASGRRHLNFSEWGKYPISKRIVKLGMIYEEVSKGDMPIPKYLYMHPDARLTSADRDSIMSWAERERDKLTGGDE